MSVVSYFDLEARKIAADGELVGLFTKHPGTLGAFREARLRSYLRDHVGQMYALSSGFVVDHDDGSPAISDRASRQIDCLIHDSSTRAPLLAAEDFSIVLPPHAAGFVEVKSQLTFTRNYCKNGVQSEEFPHSNQKGAYRWSGTLVDALENIAAVTRIMRDAKLDRLSHFAGIFAYASSGLDQFESAFASGELGSQMKIEDIDILPDAICALDKGCWMFSAYQWNDENTEYDNDYNPALSYLLGVPSGADGGTGLQLFTSLLAHSLDQRGGLDHRTGGLRSFAGRDVEIVNTPVGIPCPVKG